MAIAFRADATPIRGAGSTMTITEPTGTTQGDWLCSGIYYETAGGVNVRPPVGWQGLVSCWSPTTPFRCYIAYTMRGASAPNLTWMGVAANYHEIYTFSLSGVDPYYPIDAIGVAGAVGNAGSHTLDSPAVTPVDSNCWAICCTAWFTGAVAPVAPTGYTVRGGDGLASDFAFASKALGSGGVSEDPGAWGHSAGTGDWWDGQTWTVRPITGNADPLAGVAAIPTGLKPMFKRQLT